MAGFFYNLFRDRRKEQTKTSVCPKPYKCGLVLSGGGARGIAHLGAIKALKEQGITFDVIIGTSMGAIVGCIVADGHQPDEIMNVLTQNRLLSFIRPELNPNGLMTMKGLRKSLSRILRTANLEDLPIPCIAVATDLTNGETHYFEKGNIIDAVAASSSIPGVFPPVVINGCQYIDGGILSNLPVRYIREKCEKIIGFNVNPPSLGLHDEEAVKGMVNIVERAFHLCTVNNIQPDIALCDIYVEHTDLHKYSTFDFSKAAEIFQIGYEHTKNSAIDM